MGAQVLPCSLPNLFPASASSGVKASPSPKHLSHYQNFSRKPIKQFRLRATTNSNLETSRPLVKFPPSVWGDHFLTVHVNSSELDALAREIDALKPKVREMLVSSTQGGDKETILLIHLLVSLCLSYHFESEIEEKLKHAFEKIEDFVADEDDLYTVSILFQVFRLYGHNMSSDVFNRFKGDDGKFKECLTEDVMGMLSLHEAAYWGTPAEDIMDEALSFTLNHLESLARKASTHIAKLIETSLYLPQRLNSEIFWAREYISFYEQEKNHNEMLLKFAKLNYKYCQLHYIQELQILTKWWKGFDLTSKLPYFRDRIVECFHWASVIYFEPHYSLGRITYAKYIQLFTVLDDTFDAYGSLQECITLLDSMERWDPHAMDKMPDYLKTVCKFFWDFHREFEEQASQEGRSYCVKDTFEEIIRLTKANLAIAKWARAGYVPTFDEYMKVANVTAGIDLVLAVSYVGMGQSAGKEVYEWLKSRPKIVQVIDTKARLADDMATFKDEMSRGEIATGINCYMKQYGVTEEEAYREFQKISNGITKVVTEEFLKTTNLSREIMMRVINNERLGHVIYKTGDGLTYVDGKVKQYMTSLFVDLIDV